MSIPLTIKAQSEIPGETVRKRQRKTIAGLRVLLAEDVEMVRDLITVVPAREMVNVTAVQDGAKAVAVATAADQAFDLILLDVQMQVMGGLEATTRIRESVEAGATIPILALMANVQHRDIDRCHAAGMDGHIPKLFRPEP